MAALFPDAAMAAYDMTLPVGINAPVNPTHVVSLNMSTGEQVVFGTVSALMRLITRMRGAGLHTINPTEDTFISLAGATKMLIGEQSFVLQKLQNAGAFVYTQGRLEVRMRSGSCSESLDEALQCVGHLRTSPQPYRSTADLTAVLGVNNPRLLVVDYRYSQTDGGTTFVDDPPLQERGAFLEPDG